MTLPLERSPSTIRSSRACQEALRLRIADASTDVHLPSGLRRPILAIPVANRVRSFAVALYGPHAAGTDLDSNERAMLARLGERAADAYAQLETADLRERIATLEGELAMRASGPTPEAA